VASVTLRPAASETAFAETKTLAVEAYYASAAF
jgi:hypothetical protein